MLISLQKHINMIKNIIVILILSCVFTCSTLDYAYRFHYIGNVYDSSDSTAVINAKVKIQAAGSLIIRSDHGYFDSGSTNSAGKYDIESFFMCSKIDPMNSIQNVDSFPVIILHQNYDTLDTFIVGNRMQFTHENDYISIILPNLYLNKR